MIRHVSLRRGMLFIVIVLICSYALFESRGLLRGPVITIDIPSSGTTVTEPLIHIEGRAENISAITMNDRTIFISEEGRIDEPVALLRGYNEIAFKGTDRFGKTTRVELILIYAPQENTPAVKIPVVSASSTPPTATTTTVATSTP